MNLLPIRNYIAANTDLVPRKTLLVFSMPADLKSGVVLVPSRWAAALITRFLASTRSGFRPSCAILTTSPAWTAPRSCSTC